MEQNINPNINPNTEPCNCNKKSCIIFVVIGIIIILIGLGIWYWQIQKGKAIIPIIPSATAPTAPLTVKEDSVSTINQELSNIDVGDLNKEFQTIDTDLNSL